MAVKMTNVIIEESKIPQKTTCRITLLHYLEQYFYTPVLGLIRRISYSVNGQFLGVCSSINGNTSDCQAGAKALPSGDYGSGISYSDLTNLFTSRTDIATACKQANQALYRAAAVCIADSYRHCADNDFKTLIPTGEKYGEAIDYLCQNEASMDQILNCFGDSVLDCGANKLARAGYDSPLTSRALMFHKHKEWNCGVQQMSEECVRDDMDVQACLAAGNYDKYVALRNILRPTACGASAIIFTTSLLFVSLIVSFFH
ncbi:hypothetical protein LOTGIDRAFT_233526 [Lottia gigantea]|uniref:Uncharacterized protein n=1 Tax=Lottia gigantea TaxID=225164 RepID=V4BQ81_LOTGI|nr:hypothetical protein LOTGIDRAFT_233526 [Lottia gigantea]ESO91039.1 hypothetical protein LOTGIDRAFT_233526 [Lottia gigantea]